MKRYLLILIILGFKIITAQGTDEFRYKDYLNNSSGTLGLFIDSLNKSSGYVSVNGADTQTLVKAPDWNWGDGEKTSGFFPQSHTYNSTDKNYVLKVTAYYPGGKSDSIEIAVRFQAYTIDKIQLPDFCKVTIPNRIIRLGAHCFTAPGNLAVFPDSLFSSITREDMEYILTAVASIQAEMVNNNLYEYQGKFEEVVLRDSVFGGGYSLWNTDPVAFVLNDNYFKGSIGFSSFFHEMGHNMTLNTPADFIYGGKIDGKGNAVYSETLANIFGHVSGLELVNRAAQFGLDPSIVVDIKQSLLSSFKFMTNAYSGYISSGKIFHSWDDASTPTDETLQTFLTIAYKFFEQAELNNKNYMTACKRMMQLFQHFNLDWENRYSPLANSQSAETFRATLLAAAISFGLNMDLRNDFRDLNFPVDNNIYNELLNTVATNVNDKLYINGKYSLGQNYPNPFNPVTTIEYEISSPSDVKIEIFDVMGRKVATPEDKVRGAGRYTLKLSGDKLSSGIYFYKITAGNFVQIKKMILLK